MRRKRNLFVFILSAIVSLTAVAPVAHFAFAETRIICDLDRDGTAECITLNPRRDPTVSVTRNGKQLWQDVRRDLKPWKLVVADVDGDGKREIILGVYKSTRFFPTPHNCLFVYGWDGRRTYPKWLGSSLSKPFTDFTFADVDADRADELISVERLRDGRYCVVTYSWNGFGFTGDSQQGRWKHARLHKNARDKVSVQADGKIIPLKR